MVCAMEHPTFTLLRIYFTIFVNDKTLWNFLSICNNLNLFLLSEYVGIAGKAVDAQFIAILEAYR